MDLNVTEEWRPVLGHEDRYEVSSLGRVKSLRYRKQAGVSAILKQSTCGRYRSVVLFPPRKTRLVHSLVAEAFLGPRPKGFVVNHKDAAKTNNIPTNLEWVTPLANIHHAIAAGLRWYPSGGTHYTHIFPHRIPRGSIRGSAILKESDIPKIRKRILSGEAEATVGRDFSVSRSAIHNIIVGKTWSHVS